MRRPSDPPVVIRKANASTRVLLVHAPYPGRLKFDSQPSSLLCAASGVIEALDEQGRLDEVGYLDPRGATEEFYKELSSIVAAGNVQVVCASTSTAAIEEAARVASVSRASAPGDVLIVGGGPHEDDVDEKMAHRLTDYDISIAGDAEQVLWSVVRMALERGSAAAVLSLGDIARDPRLKGRGVISVTGGHRHEWVSRTPVGPELVLHRPWTDRVVNFPVFGNRPTLPLMISRGCSYGKCTFCAEAGGGRQSVVGDFSRIQALIDGHPGAALYFQDSIFPSSKFVREKLLPMLRDSGRPWGCQIYLPTLSSRFANDLAQSGCNYLYTGIESGSEELRAAVGKGGLRSSVLERKAQVIGATGMRLGISVMLGVLDRKGWLLESPESLKETLVAVRRVQESVPEVAGVYPNVLTVLPGTALAGILRGHESFYRMPLSGEFREIEDGEVGYNFLTLGCIEQSGALVSGIKVATSALLQMVSAC